MCGRYVRRFDNQRIVDFVPAGTTVFDIPSFDNIAPTTSQLVIQMDRDTGEREIAMMLWAGLHLDTVGELSLVLIQCNSR